MPCLLCALPNHVQSTEFTTGRLQSFVGPSKRCGNGSIIFLYVINLQEFQANFFHFVIMGIFCSERNESNPCWNKGVIWNKQSAANTLQMHRMHFYFWSLKNR